MTQRILFLLAVCSAVGCGTLANMQGKRRPMLDAPTHEPRLFGGAVNDVRWVGEGFDDALAAQDALTVPERMAVIGYFALIDLPLSFVGDVLTLPWLLWSETDRSNSMSEVESLPQR
jgi:uncharacterized protein YceK